jgi:citrate synthase
MNIDVEDLISRVLRLKRSEINDDLSYLSVPAWDSFRHVELMLALEEATGHEILDHAVTELTSLGSIRAFVESGGNVASHEIGLKDHLKPTRISKGLRDVYLDHSSISSIDGTKGRLEYRGYDVRDLVRGASFEEVAWLVLYGELPSASDLLKFRTALVSMMKLPRSVMLILPSLKDFHPMDAMRVGLAMLSVCHNGDREETADEVRSNGLMLMSQIAAFIGAHHRLRRGLPELEPDERYGLAKNLFLMISDIEDAAGLVKFLEQDLILHAEHGSCASTLAARTAISTAAPVSHALMAAISVFSGRLHGGALEKTMDMVDEIEDPSSVEAYVQECLSRGAPIFGFGHSVYRVEDPRCLLMKESVHRLTVDVGEIDGSTKVAALVKSMKPMAAHGIHPNVDLYAGLVHRALGFEKDLSIPIFIVSRLVGWIAHCCEQRERNALIRPLLKYIGPSSREYSPSA